MSYSVGGLGAENMCSHLRTEPRIQCVCAPRRAIHHAYNKGLFAWRWKFMVALLCPNNSAQRVSGWQPLPKTAALLSIKKHLHMLNFRCDQQDSYRLLSNKISGSTSMGRRVAWWMESRRRVFLLSEKRKKERHTVWTLTILLITYLKNVHAVNIFMCIHDKFKYNTSEFIVSQLKSTTAAADPSVSETQQRDEVLQAADRQWSDTWQAAWLRGERRGGEMWDTPKVPGAEEIQN